MPSKTKGIKEVDDRTDDREGRYKESYQKKGIPDIWDTETSEEWVSFSNGVAIDVVIENPEAFQKETPWGTAIVIQVREFPRDSLVGGIPKLLKLESKRLIKGLKLATPAGIPATGDGYIIVRSGEGFNTTYQVSYNGNFSLLKGGMREPVEEFQKA